MRTFLDFLGVGIRTPDRELLDELVEGHQLKIPFETLTKLVDYEQGRETGRFLPSVEDYVRRVASLGCGGTCWSLARGFEWLLSRLGFEVSYMIMAPGHCCLRVELDQPYYVDVGYAAPLFRAYPLYESFETADARCRFGYIVNGDEIITTQEPGPRKVLDPTPRTFDEFEDRIAAANEWTPDSFLTNLSIFTYIDGVPTSLKNGVLKRYEQEGLREWRLSNDETLDWIERRFGMDPEIYVEAHAVHTKWMRRHGLNPSGA